MDSFNDEETSFLLDVTDNEGELLLDDMSLGVWESFLTVLTIPLLGTFEWKSFCELSTIFPSASHVQESMQTPRTGSDSENQTVILLSRKLFRKVLLSTFVPMYYLISSFTLCLPRSYK